MILTIVNIICLTIDPSKFYKIRFFTGNIIMNKLFIQIKSISFPKRSHRHCQEKVIIKNYNREKDQISDTHLEQMLMVC